ncbi:hypothetical protein [Enterococcus olivae]
MRLTKKDTQEVILKKRQVTIVPKGGEKIEYIEPKPIRMTIQPAEGLVMAQIYGNKLSTVKACKYIGTDIIEGQNELDGVCVYVSEDEKPDFYISSIKTYSQHTNVVLERL